MAGKSAPTASRLSVGSQRKGWSEWLARRGGWIVAVIAIGAYLGNLDNDFVYDDRYVVLENPSVQQRDWRSLAIGSYWGELVDAGLYRPVTSLSFGLNHLLMGPEPFGFHLINDLLHALASAMVFWLVVRLAEATRLVAPGPVVAFVAATLFALHPIHVEAVTSIVGRADVLSCLFVLVGLWIVAGRTDGTARSSLLLGVTFFLALGSKESAVFALPLFFLLDLLLRQRIRRHYAVAVCVALTAYVFVRAVVLGGLGISGREIGFIDNPLAHVGWPARVAGGFVVLAEYFKLLWWPWPQSADYSFDQLPVLRLGLPNLAGVALFTVWAVALARAARLPSRAFVAFALAALGLPLLGLVHWMFPLGTVLGERLLYLPSVGFCLVFAWLIVWSGSVWSRRGSFLVSVVVVFLAVASIHVRNRHWRSNGVLFEQTVASAPGSARAHFLLASARLEQGRFDQAVDAFEAGLRIYPEHVPAHFSWADALVRQERHEEAAEVYRRVIRLEPSADAFAGLGNSLQSADRLEDALDALTEASRRFPGLGFDSQLDRLALVAATAPGRDDSGIEQALRSGWDLRASAGLANALGIHAGMKGDYDVARSWHERALGVEPNNALAVNYLGVVAERQGLTEKSRNYYEQALTLNPELVPAVLNLGSWLMRRGNLAQAEARYRQAVLLSPSSYEAQNSLGIALARQGRSSEAAESFRRAIAIDSLSGAARDNLAALGRLP